MLARCFFYTLRIKLIRYVFYPLHPPISPKPLLQDKSSNKINIVVQSNSIPFPQIERSNIIQTIVQMQSLSPCPLCPPNILPKKFIIHISPFNRFRLVCIFHMAPENTQKSKWKLFLLCFASILCTYHYICVTPKMLLIISMFFQKSLFSTK